MSQKVQTMRREELDTHHNLNEDSELSGRKKPVLKGHMPRESVYTAF